MQQWFEQSRTTLTVVVGGVIGLVLWTFFPFDFSNPVLRLIAARTPALHTTFAVSWTVMLFTAPLLAIATMLAQLNVRLARKAPVLPPGKLPPFPKPDEREELYVILGEVHDPADVKASPEPKWISIPARGLACGTAVFGAIGSGKTSSCILPFANQLFSYKAADPERKLSGLVLEVKGDLCYAIRAQLAAAGRAADYVELSLTSTLRYNPLANDLDAYSQAYAIASLLSNLFGKGSEPFWQQAYSNLLKGIITLHRLVDGYVTLLDLYKCAINEHELERKMNEGALKFGDGREYLLIDPASMEHPESVKAGRLAKKFTYHEHWGKYRCLADDDKGQTKYFLGREEIPYEVRKGQFEDDDADYDTQKWVAVQRWYEQDWKHLMGKDGKLSASIVEGISVFLSLFDDNPAIKYVFCPPKKVFDPTQNVVRPDGSYTFGKPLTSLDTLIEDGRVLALNLPSGLNPGLAKAIGTLVKLDFQRSMLARIPKMTAPESAGKHFREVVFLCDEYQSFASTGGQGDPNGDDRFFSLSRQPKCIPLIATQSLSSVESVLSTKAATNTLLQTFRTKVFLTLSDPESAKQAATMSGREDKPYVKFNTSERASDAKVSLLSGRTVGETHDVTVTKAYELKEKDRFTAKDFGELEIYQAIVMAFDGVNQQPAQRVYLKPAHRPVDLTWFEQRDLGMHP